MNRLLVAFLLTAFTARNRVLVIMDWMKSYMFGRDVSRE
jgi:NADH:ubiquinone reductase (non-electrogenic)